MDTEIHTATKRGRCAYPGQRGSGKASPDMPSSGARKWPSRPPEHSDQSRISWLEAEQYVNEGTVAVFSVLLVADDPLREYENRTHTEEPAEREIER